MSLVRIQADAPSKIMNIIYFLELVFIITFKVFVFISMATLIIAIPAGLIFSLSSRKLLNLLNRYENWSNSLNYFAVIKYFNLLPIDNDPQPLQLRKRILRFYRIWFFAFIIFLIPF